MRQTLAQFAALTLAVVLGVAMLGLVFDYAANSTSGLPLQQTQQKTKKPSAGVKLLAADDARNNSH